MMAVMKRIRDLDFDAIAAEVTRRTSRANRNSGDGLINNDLLWITSPESAVTRLRNHLVGAALRHARTLDDVRFERPVVQAFVRAQHHPLAPPLPKVAVQNCIEGPDATPRLTAIADAHPELGWDPDAVQQLLLSELREVHGDHALDDSEPPHRMHWGPGSAAAYALRLLLTLRALGEI
jgi:hypothetical protein